MSKNILITGACGGIGQAITNKMLEMDWTVYGIDREEGLFKGQHFFKVDVSSFEEVQFIKNSISSIDCIVNNSAILIKKNLLDTQPEEWHQVLNTNLGGVFNTCKTFIPQMNCGSIINISSVHSRASSKGFASYAASKGGVGAITRVLALELASKNIRVNSIIPGAIDTPMLIEGAPSFDNLIEKIPLNKIGKPGDIAELVAFLSDGKKAGFITGQEFICDGGILAKLASE